MIHRFVDLLEEPSPYPIVPIMGDVPAVQTVFVWTIGEGLPPNQLTFSGRSTANSGVMGDPRLSPDETEVVYSYTQDPSGATPPFGEIRVVDVANTTDTLVLGGLTPFTSNNSHGPCWSPDGSYIVFSERPAPPGIGNTKISRVDRDGTGYTVLYTIPGGGFPSNQTFSPSGNYICFCVRNFGSPAQIWTMAPDGTGAANIYTCQDYELNFGERQWPAWQHGADVLGFCDLDSDLDASNLFRTINADGTGLTTIYTDSARVYHGPHQYGWLTDDSALVAWKRTNGTTVFDATEGIVATIDAAGGGPTDSGEDFGTAGLYKTPQVIDTTREAPRIYFSKILSGGTRRSVASVLEDFSDYRVDFDGDATLAGANPVTHAYMYGRHTA